MTKDNTDPGFIGNHVRDSEPELVAMPDPAASEGWLPEGIEAPAEDQVTPRDVADPEVEAARGELYDPADDHTFDSPEPLDLGALLTPPAPPLQILVVGSHGFRNPGIVASVLGDWLDAHAPRAVLMATSGAPDGAEGLAASYAHSRGVQVASVRDEQIMPGMFAHVFAFMAGDTPGASRTLEVAKWAGASVTRVSIEDIEATGPWAER